MILGFTWGDVLVVFAVVLFLSLLLAVVINLVIIAFEDTLKAIRRSVRARGKHR